LGDGETLSDVTSDLNQAMGIKHPILPMTDQPVSTRVSTKDNVLKFQDYFVRQKCKPEVTGFEFLGVESAEPAPGVLESIQTAGMVVICPSNPWVSIGPVLAVPEIYQAILKRPVRLAVSPIIGGKALKGPAAKMYKEMGIEPSAAAVANQYKNLINGFVFDYTDLSMRKTIEKMGLRTLVTDTVMNNGEKRRELAQRILEFGINFR
jgi:LPPG:FO 2-phospho-L-lactate transferase